MLQVMINNTKNMHREWGGALWISPNEQIFRKLSNNITDTIEVLKKGFYRIHITMRTQGTNGYIGLYINGNEYSVTPTGASQNNNSMLISSDIDEIVYLQSMNTIKIYSSNPYPSSGGMSTLMIEKLIA